MAAPMAASMDENERNGAEKAKPTGPDVAAAMDAITERNARESPLLQLPAEIRNRIYKYAFGGQLVRVRRPRSENFEFIFYASKQGGSVRSILPPATICRQVYRESALFPYGYNTFIFVEPYSVKLLNKEQKHAIEIIVVGSFDRHSALLDISMNTLAAGSGLREIIHRYNRHDASYAKMKSYAEKIGAKFVDESWETNDDI